MGVKYVEVMDAANDEELPVRMLARPLYKMPSPDSRSYEADMERVIDLVDTYRLRHVL